MRTTGVSALNTVVLLHVASMFTRLVACTSTCWVRMAYIRAADIANNPNDICTSDPMSQSHFHGGPCKARCTSRGRQGTPRTSNVTSRRHSRELLRMAKFSHKMADGRGAGTT